MCRCGAVVKEFARADKSGSTPGDSVFCVFAPFLFCFVSFFNTIFRFDLYFFFLTAEPAGHALGSIYILSLSPGFILEKGFQNLFICILAKLTTRKKPEAVKTCPSSETAEFFSTLVDIMTNNTQYTTNCTNLHPTSTSDPLAKVKLAFCTSS